MSISIPERNVGFSYEEIKTGTFSAYRQLSGYAVNDSRLGRYSSFKQGKNNWRKKLSVPMFFICSAFYIFIFFECLKQFDLAIRFKGQWDRLKGK